MSEEQNKEIIDITALYVAELESGKQPHLSDYVERYPHYAASIAQFVAYYHAIEAPTQQKDTLQQASQEAILTLYITASGRYLAPAALARQLALSIDIVRLLDNRMIDLVTLPSALICKLALLLEQPESAIYDFLAEPAQQDHQAKTSQQMVAEEHARYFVQDQRKYSFRELIFNSVELSFKQKVAWWSILEREQL